MASGAEHPSSSSNPPTSASAFSTAPSSLPLPNSFQFTSTTTTSTTSSNKSLDDVPSSILIVGSGVFGLSTALSLARRPAFARTTITVVDRSTEPGVFPSRDASSVDTSRIIRADYSDPAYASLAAEAQEIWRQNTSPDSLGAQGRYSEKGLLLVADDSSAPKPTLGKGKGKSGMDYARSSWENVKALVSTDASLSSKIEELPSPEAIRKVYGTGGSTGSWGYINRLSGWADAEACMDWLYRKVQATGRVKFINGTASSLLYNSNSKTEVKGVKLCSGEALRADLTVLATGAWTSGLIDMTGRAVSTGQVLAYMDITDEEQAKLSDIPTLLNLSTGYFIITPSRNNLKIAQHAYGYINPTTNPVTGLRSSAPVTHLTNSNLSIPPSDQVALRKALTDMIPWPSLRNRPFKATRLCWYTDTPDGDFIIDYHPDHKGLFLATGGSGHGFKFLPVIGEKVTDCILGNCPEIFRGKWSWKMTEGVTATSWDKVVTEDGSRGGLPGLILQVNMDKSPDQESRTSRL